MGVDSNVFDEWSKRAKDIGFESKDVFKMFNKLNTEFGKAASQNKPSEEMEQALQTLGLEYEKLKDMAPGEQFNEIMNAAEASGSINQALPAVTELLGEDAAALAAYYNFSKDEPERNLVLEEFQREIEPNLKKRYKERYKKEGSDKRTGDKNLPSQNTPAETAEKSTTSVVSKETPITPAPEEKAITKESAKQEATRSPVLGETLKKLLAELETLTTHTTGLSEAFAPLVEDSEKVATNFNTLGEQLPSIMENFSSASAAFDRYDLARYMQPPPTVASVLPYPYYTTPQTPYDTPPLPASQDKFDELINTLKSTTQGNTLNQDNRMNVQLTINQREGEPAEAVADRATQNLRDLQENRTASPEPLGNDPLIKDVPWAR